MHGGGGRDIELIYGGWRRGRRNERKKERCASNEKESEILYSDQEYWLEKSTEKQ